MARGTRVVAAAALWHSMPGASVAATVSSIVTTAGPGSSQVRGARVILFDPGFSIFLEARTDWLGRYRLQAPPGSYSGIASRIAVRFPSSPHRGTRPPAAQGGPSGGQRAPAYGPNVKAQGPPGGAWSSTGAPASSLSVTRAVPEPASTSTRP